MFHQGNKCRIWKGIGKTDPVGPAFAVVDVDARDLRLFAGIQGKTRRGNLRAGSHHCVAITLVARRLAGFNKLVWQAQADLVRGEPVLKLCYRSPEGALVVQVSLNDQGQPSYYRDGPCQE